MHPRATTRHAARAAWPLLAAASVVMAASFVVVFLADGAAPGLPIVRDAIANTVAAIIAGAPVWWLCQRLPWHHAFRWWFFPVHGAAVVAFAILWYLSIGVALGVAVWLTGGPLHVLFLRGPALHWEMMTAVVLYFAIAATTYSLQAIRDAERAAALLHEAEVRALRAQLDPHLLFNTLHSLLELVRSGDERADDAIEQFARVARYVTDGRSDRHGLATLREEWQMTQDYLALESLRLGPRLHCTLDLAPAIADVRLPALTVQPLVENAIRHGVAPRPGPGHIRVEARESAGLVTIVIDDDGLGRAATTRGSGSGLALVRKRLQATFGAEVQFAAHPKDGTTGWRVELAIPATGAT